MACRGQTHNVEATLATGQKVDFADSGVHTTWGSIQTGQEAMGRKSRAFVPIEGSGFIDPS